MIISISLFIENNLEAILISIDQVGSMISASSVIYDNPNLIKNFNYIKSRITIFSNVEYKLKTIFQHSSFKTELIFSKIPGPQEPSPFFEYEQKNVTIKNKVIILNGTLTIPSNKSFLNEGKFPAIILITGSGLRNRDEEILRHKPFLVISDFLIKLGFAILRFDDRDTGLDINIFSNSDIFDFVGDLICQINYLKSLYFIILLIAQ